MHTNLKLILVLLSCLFCFSSNARSEGANSPAADSAPQRVLMLWSYPRGYPWVLEVDRYFNDFARNEIASRSAGVRVILEEESLYFQGEKTSVWPQSYVDQLAERYAGKHFDRIITIDAPASVFMRDHGSIFSYAKLIQVSQSPAPNLPHGVYFQGEVNEAAEAWKNINKTFTPTATKTYLIANTDTIANQMGGVIRGNTNWLEQGKFEHLDPDVLRIEQIKQTLKNAGPEWRILVLPVSTSIEYGEVIPRQYIKELSQGLDRPIYCTVSSFLGSGCLAGYGQTSRLFAKMAARGVYGDINPDSPLMFTEYFVDEAKLQSLGFDRPDWMERALVVNPQTSFWEENARAVLTGAFVTLVFSVILIVVLMQRSLLLAAKFELQSRTVRLNNILHGTNVGTWEWNVQTGETRFNERWAEIIGYRLAELEPTTIETWMKFAHPTDLEGSGELLEAHFKGEAQFYELEARMKHRNGEWVWVLDRGQVATWTPDGKPEWMFGTHQEITARKRLEDELKKRKEEAETALKVKSEFLAAMSHEIRTPMNGVLGLTELAKNETSLDKKQFYLDGIQRSGKLLMSILNDILDFSKLEAGRTKLQQEVFDVPSLFNESIELFRASANVNGIDLNLNLSNSVPNRLLGDPIKISQMVNNYVGNAIKFTARGAVTLHVNAEVLGDQVKLIVECEDSGIGIHESEIKKLFKPFSQLAQDSKVKASGTGLGLVLVQEYANLMGGKCGVRSTVGVGSVFWFEVLLSKTEEIPTESAPPENVDPHQLSGKHVLIVEDNEMNTLIIKALLDQYNISYDTAVNGVEAIQRFESSLDGGQPSYDAILMDVQMPIMNGLEATRHIRSKNNCSIPILGLTAGVLPEERADCIQAGMSAFLAKPIDTKKLFSELIRLTMNSS